MLTIGDAFAGAGGFSLAASRAGYGLAFAMEKNRHAIATYRSNFCKSADGPILFEGDIAGMAPRSVRAALEAKGRNGCDLLLGGPPCQGFSTHRIKGAGVADQRNELIGVYFGLVRELRPTAFLMENVPGMLWPRHARHLERLYAEGAAAGYHLYEPAVLDARDYGAPQRRRRVFVLGVVLDAPIADFAWPPAPSHGDAAARALDPELSPWRSCAAAFAPSWDGDPNDLHMNHSPELVEAFARTPHNGGSRAQSGRTLSCHRDHDGHSDVYGRIDPSQPAPTMTTACINPSKGRFVHPTRDHGITVRQAARIQGFPDDFVFHGGLMAAGAQVGNAVPVALGTALLEHLKPLLARAAGLSIAA